MSSEDKTLKDTVAEALSANKDSGNVVVAETEKGISQKDTSTETQTGGTAEYVSGIDISDIPEQDRPRIKDLLSKKAKLLEDGYQPKFQEVSKLKKTQEDLIASGLSVDEARDVLLKHIENKKNPKADITQTQKKESLKVLDKLIADAPYEQRSTLEQMRQIIHEETEVSEIKKQLKEITDTLGIYRQSAYNTRQKQLNEEVSVLREKFGNDFIDKYADTILERGGQHPNLSASQILKFEAPMEELEQAILTKGKKPLTQEKKNSISSVPSGIASSTEKIDIKKSSIQDILMKGIGKR